MQKPNIVQAEFFHVGGEPGMSFNAFLGQVQERILDGFSDLRAGMNPADVRIGIKTCVRFYDYTGAVTREVAREQKAREYLDRTLKEPGEQMSLIRRYLLYRRVKRLLKEASPYTRLSHALCTKALAAALRKQNPVVIETWDHRFRPLKREEAHEVLEGIRRSKHSWIFCFEHNDLLADENKSVAHAI